MTLPQFIADARKLCEPIVVHVEPSRVFTLTTAETGEEMDIETGGVVTTQEHSAQQALSRALDMIEVMQSGFDVVYANAVSEDCGPEFEFIRVTCEKLKAQISKLAGEKV